jgi:hypothetical protein
MKIQLENSKMVAFNHAGHRLAALLLSSPMPVNYRSKANLQ